MSPLDKKLLRDVRRLWAQALAISLVMAGGVATVLLAIGSYRSLDETRIIDDARGSRDHRTGGALERPLEDERFDLMESLDAGGLGDIGG